MTNQRTAWESGFEYRQVCTCLQYTIEANNASYNQRWIIIFLYFQTVAFTCACLKTAWNHVQACVTSGHIIGKFPSLGAYFSFKGVVWEGRSVIREWGMLTGWMAEITLAHPWEQEAMSDARKTLTPTVFLPYPNPSLHYLCLFFFFQGALILLVLSPLQMWNVWMLLLTEWFPDSLFF